MNIEDLCEAMGVGMSKMRKILKSAQKLGRLESTRLPSINIVGDKTMIPHYRLK